MKREAHVAAEQRKAAVRRVLLFNSLSWPRTEVSEVEVQLPAPARQIEFTIASPTGEGLTSPRSFSRWRRCTLVGHFRIV